MDLALGSAAQRNRPLKPFDRRAVASTTWRRSSPTSECVLSRSVASTRDHVGTFRRGMGSAPGRRMEPDVNPSGGSHDADPPPLRVSGAHVVDRYLVVEWYSRMSPVNTYRHLWWFGHS